MEIHPETPPQGVPMTSRFRQEDIDRMMEHLRTMGAPLGITFADRPFLSNSRSALMAAEFARDQGKFEPFHGSLFASYFSHGLDIGSMEVLRQLGMDAGLDAGALEDAVKSGRYLPRLQKAQEAAARAGVTGVPTFVIGHKKTIVGAQPLDVFRKTIRSLQN